MGVDIILSLPSDVRVRDVMDVIGILAGCVVEERQSMYGAYKVVVGVKLKGCEDIPCSDITIMSPETMGGTRAHSVLYHYEGQNGQRLLCPRSTAFWIATARRLVDFFGGSLIYQDSEGDKPDYQKRRPRKTNGPEDGKPWEDFQRAKFSLKPLTEEELKAADKWAAYKLSD